MAPYPLVADTVTYALVFGAFGIAFGAVLEMAGFGDTRKLAAQFYFKDLTVLKVMFTGIAVSAVLVAGASAFGLLDMSRVWVNPTYLWPGIVGGLVMGVGFILGGFCPGTSVVAAATLKLDGALFLLGVLAGVGLFGETVGSFQGFFLSSYMGRFTLPDLFGIPVGATVLLVVAFALFMFWGGELLERRFGQGRPQADGAPRSLAKVGGAVALLLVAGLVAVRGQPSPLEKFDLLGPEGRRPVEQREIFVDPAEVVTLRKDLNVQVVVLDLRDEHDFNLFHLGGARRVDPSALYAADTVKALLDQSASTVTFLTGHGEAGALAAWKGLKALGVSNLYVIEGGMNGWLSRYGVPTCAATRAADPPAADDAPAYRFAYATGASLPAAWPELSRSRSFQAPCQDPMSHVDGAAHEVIWPSYAFTKKVRLQTKAAVKGGCG